MGRTEFASGREETWSSGGNGDISYTAPIAWQEFDGARNVVGVGYVLDNDAFGYGFALAAYDASRPLIIDPLLQSTYLGGNGFDVAAGIAIHPATGDVYVVGTTLSSDFPSVVGAEQPGNAALYDVFVTRLNAALTTRLQSTYIGGSSDDFGNAIAIHPVSGEIYVTGQTTSADFPKIVGSEQPVKAPGSDGFVTRLNAALTARLQSTYLGGNDNDIPTSIAIHPVSGEVYVTGQTASSDFPKVAGSEQPVKGGAGTTDAFVTRLNAALTQRLQSTYVGGSGNDGASAIAIHPVTGEVYIGGVTTSADLPKVTGSEQPVKGVNFDGFVTRLNAALTLRLQSTYLGGNAGDQVNGLAIHPMTGEIYAAGYTTSTDFPKLAGSEQTVKNALADGYVTRFNPSLTNILQSTLIGGNGDDFLQSVAIHPLTGEVYVAGYVLGTTDFPKTAGAEQPAKAAGMDSVIVRLNAGLTTRLQATYLGASGDDYLAAGMTIHPVTGEIYLAGRTSSTDFPKVSGSEQPTKSTIEDAFVARYSADLTLNDNVPDTFGNFAAQSGVPVQSVRTSNPLRITGIFGSANLYIDGQPGSSYCISSANNCSCDVSGGFLTAPTTVGNNAYVCVRHTASAALNQLSRTDLHVGGGRASFIATTGALIGGSCTLDVDGDGGIDALSDGLIMLRAMFGLTGTSVTANAVRPGATRTIWAQIQPYLNGNCGTSFAP